MTKWFMDKQETYVWRVLPHRKNDELEIPTKYGLIYYKLGDSERIRVTFGADRQIIERSFDDNKYDKQRVIRTTKISKRRLTALLDEHFKREFPEGK